MPNLEHCINIAQASEKSGISRRTILHHIRNGQLKATKLAGRTGAYLIAISDFDNYITERNKKDGS